MSIDIFAPAQWQTQRWQNGGGITHQLCRQDDEQGLLWRLSIAEVASDGPFSRFDNIDRIIMLLSGGGFSLHGVGANPQVLDTPLMPFAFAGETPIHCSLIKGAVRDFNLMTRRGAVQAQLQVLTISSAVQTLALSAQSLVYVASGRVNALIGAKHITLQAQHTLSLTNESNSLQISSSDNAQVIIIGISGAQ
ncbi:MAG: HutD family protein [Gammaproteobacteria bacterium]|nr:HutD family protein [Gammaproteobacteria bacterium]MBU1556638.1 HutD family protein [Gammaproteobacteria bacterium]MBU2069793.1 HutD family protein [Gammaproteobacteria bacterium]MBU2184658.1 HutD family protein [Gammaproteobacteria bacterium]MBU2205676.1 HutD family protein [Gammaproteobacteria bacterium]